MKFLPVRWIQIVLCAFLAFGSQGVWNALNALGGGGTKEIRTATISNTVLSATGFSLGWLSGGIVNVIGPRLAITFGVFSCGLFLTLFYCFAYHRYVPEWTVVFAAGLDGLGNCCMWAALGTVLMFYPHAHEKGKALSVFNMIFNIGGVGGALLAFFLNLNSTESDRNAVSDTAMSMSGPSYLSIASITYAAFILSFFLMNPLKFVSASARLALEITSKPLDEVKGIASAAKEKTTLFMALLYCMTIWHEVVLYNWINANYNNVRTRAFNSAIYWFSRILFTFPLQCLLDKPGRSARVNGTRGAIYFTCVLGCAILIGTLICTLSIYRRSLPLFDFTQAYAALPMVAMILYGAVDTLAQGMVIWIISEYPGANPGSVARHSGLFRCLQALGSMIAWSLDVNHWTPFRVQYAISSILWGLSLPGLFIVLRKYVSSIAQSRSSAAWMAQAPERIPLIAMSSARLIGSMAESFSKISDSLVLSRQDFSIELSPGIESDILLSGEELPPVSKTAPKLSTRLEASEVRKSRSRPGLQPVGLAS